MIGHFRKRKSTSKIFVTRNVTYDQTFNILPFMGVIATH